MPDDSFVLKYFKYLNKYLSVGPPFYIVINNTQIAKGKGYGFDFFKTGSVEARAATPTRCKPR
jgi:hypothetical protein